MPNLNIMCSMSSRERQPFEHLARCRIVPKIDSIGLLVRILCQCFPGSHKMPSVPHDLSVSTRWPLGTSPHRFLRISQMPCVRLLSSPLARCCAAPALLLVEMTSANSSAHSGSCASHSVVGVFLDTLLPV